MSYFNCKSVDLNKLAYFEQCDSLSDGQGLSQSKFDIYWL